MVKLILLLFLIGHILGDFYLQSDRLALAKDISFKKLLEHSLIYTCAIVIMIIPVFSGEFLILALFISIAHFAIDLLKYILKKYKSIKILSDFSSYIIDQFFHILTIFFVVVMIYYLSLPINYINLAHRLIEEIGINHTHIFSWILILLLIAKPFSITIRKILNRYKPINTDYDGHPNAGSLIGILERMIILLFLSVGQYSAIGFVLTAKSIARYNKIAEDPMFSEYYLLGTLLSALLVIISYLVIF